MARRLSAFVVSALIVLIASVAFGDDDVITLSYDDGGAEQWFADSLPDTVENIMFFMEHPAYLHGFQIMFSGTGPVEVHVWADGGGNDPDQSADLVEPFVVDVSAEQALEWMDFDLSAAPIALAPLHYVHIGIIRQSGGAGLAIDTGSQEGWSSIYPADDPTVKYSIGETGNFMVRAQVAYHDQNTAPLFVRLDDMPAITRAAWGDFDDDGDDDLLAAAGKLYRNNGDGTFTDISEAAGIAGLSGSGVWADYDNDGFLDYYAFSRGTDDATRDRLVKNNGDGTFTPIDSSERVPFDYDPTEAAAWADYDNDGWVDLFAANYETELSMGTQDRIWHNLGGGVFEDVTETIGVYTRVNYCGRGAIWGDFNNDNCIDLYVANYRLDPNQLYVNNCNGGLRDMATFRGVAGENVQGNFGHSIGASFGDTNNDGLLDLVVGNLAHPRFIEFSDQTMLYENLGAAQDFDFADRREQAGIAFSETHSDTLLFDYDNDGWLDLAITGIYTEYVSFLYRNQHDGSFADVSYDTGLWMFNGWGIATADYDRDGDLDVASRKFFKNTLNDGAKVAPNNWLQVKLVGHKTNTAGIGCRVTVTAGGTTQMREVEGGKGTGVQSSLVQHFGLGTSAQAERVVVRWVDGSESELTDVAANQRIVVEEAAEPVCLNRMGECLSDTRLKVCRNWQWTEEDCPTGWVCEERFCVDPNSEDGDEDGDVDSELDGDLDAESEPDGDQPEDGDVDAEPDSELPAEHYLITPRGGRIETPEGVIVYAPPFAVDDDLIIRIQQQDDDVISGIDPISGVFRFLPAGRQFAKALTVSIPYDTGKAASDALEFYWSHDDDEMQLDPQPDAQFNDGLATAAVTHFSLGFVANGENAPDGDEPEDGDVPDPGGSGGGCQHGSGAWPGWLLLIVVVGLLRWTTNHGINDTGEKPLRP